MTLGPAAIVCSLVDKLPIWLVNPFVTLGRVPFAFYVTHFYLIHLLALILGLVQGFPANSFITHFVYFPADYGLTLGGVYATWLFVLVLMYPLCLWVAKIKARRKDWWLSYI